MLTNRELERYRRQIALFGEEAQERLASAVAVIAGAGGLGGARSPSTLPPPASGRSGS